MTGFWEKSFVEWQTMWGLEPSDSAILANGFFTDKGIKDVLIPGIGYGRNAKLFIDNGIQVTGIEISQTAINLAKTHYGNAMKIHHGSVTDMPFDSHLYEGVFCYGLLYLLNGEERNQLIDDCYNQLLPNGDMVFSVISKSSPNYGMGKQLGKDWFEMPKGVNLFFYDEESIRLEFGNYGLSEWVEIDEPIKNRTNKPPFKFWVIKCHKSPKSE